MNPMLKNNVCSFQNPFKTSDTVRILLLQFSCLLVDEGAAHIHDAGKLKIFLLLLFMKIGFIAFQFLILTSYS